MSLIIPRSSAQTLALRTNLLYDATLSPNLGVEVRLDSTWSAGINVGFNAWDIDKEKNKKWRHLLVSPNVRHYFGHKRDSLCVYGYAKDGAYGILRDSVVTRRMQYFEGNLIYSHYNVGNAKIPFGLYSAIKDRRLQGDLLALGAKYGYAWMWAIRGYYWPGSHVQLYMSDYETPNCTTLVAGYIFNYFPDIKYIGFGCNKGKPGELWEPKIIVVRNMNYLKDDLSNKQTEESV